MLAPFIIAYTFAGLFSWRLVSVVATSADQKHRQDAIRLCGYIWGGSSIAGGLVTGLVQLHQSGALAQLLQ